MSFIYWPQRSATFTKFTTKSTRRHYSPYLQAQNILEPLKVLNSNENKTTNTSTDPVSINTVLIEHSGIYSPSCTRFIHKPTIRWSVIYTVQINRSKWHINMSNWSDKHNYTKYIILLASLLEYLFIRSGVIKESTLWISFCYETILRVDSHEGVIYSTGKSQIARDGFAWLFENFSHERSCSKCYFLFTLYSSVRVLMSNTLMDNH